MVPLLAILTAVDARIAGADAPAPAPVVPPTPAPWTMPAADVAAIHALIDTAVAHGFPDARGGRLKRGRIVLKGDRGILLSLNQTNAQWSSGSDDKGGQVLTVDGFHISLADGGWLVNLGQWVGPGSPIAVEAEGLIEATPEQVMAADPQQETPAYTDEVLRQWVDTYAEDQRPMIRAAMPMLPLIVKTMMDGDREGRIPIHLIRCGFPDAMHLVVLQAAFQAQVSSIGVTDSHDILVLTDADRQRVQRARFAKMQADAGKQKKDATGGLRIIPVATVVRAMLSHWFLAQSTTSRPMLPLERVRSAAEALLPADAPERRQLTRLIERAAIPVKPAPGADLAARLASWTGADRSEKTATDGDEPDAAEAKSLFAFTVADIGSLIALAGDTRASRRLESSDDEMWGRQPGRAIVRTVGDNALLAIARMLGVDPRPLAGRDPDATWTDDERNATAAALAAWWKDRAQRSVGELLAEGVPRLSGDALIAVLEKRDDGERAPLIAAIAAHWSRQEAGKRAPRDMTPLHLAGLLALSGSDPAIVTVVATWPVEGDARLVLATWYQLRGDGSVVDALFGDLIEGRVENRTDDGREDADPSGRNDPLPGTLAVIAHHPTPARLTQVLDAVAGRLDALIPRRVLATCISSVGQSSWLLGEDVRALLDTDRSERDDSARAIPLAVLAAALGDTRPLPAGMVEIHGAWLRLNGEQHLMLPQAEPRAVDGKTVAESEPKPLPADMRVCDLAAIAQVAADRNKRRQGKDGPPSPSFDHTGTIADRDAQIAMLASALGADLSAALKAAKLPDIVPATPAGAGDSLF